MKTFVQIAKVAGLLLLVMFLASCSKSEDKNSAPVINSILVNPASINAGGVVTIIVSATDKDNDAMTYTYTPTGGAITGTGSTVTWTAPTVPGAYSVNVTVSDGNGGSVSGSALLTVMQTATRIVGTASFPVGIGNDLIGAKVSIYTTYDNWVNNTPVKFTSVKGSGPTVSFDMEVAPGNYYLDIWKDVDADGVWDAGDYYGWYGGGGLGSILISDFQIVQNETKSFTITMYVL